MITDEYDRPITLITKKKDKLLVIIEVYMPNSQHTDEEVEECYKKDYF